MDQDAPNQTHFGFQQVPVADKARRVGAVFDSVATRYDLMNDLMSFGLHRIWKRFALSQTGLRPGGRALDIAGGTGDIARGLARQVGDAGSVTMADINRAMLDEGRRHLVDAGFGARVALCQADAEALPFRDDWFDCATIAFGLRNVTRKENALASIYRVLRPGGRLLVLEFSQPTLAAIEPLYDLYSFRVLPWLGKTIAHDAPSYQYLAESIRMHPDQLTLKAMMETAGFEQCRYFNLSGGIVALHVGYKF
ncbi:MAG TPA: bifunctional demethylmenaquinone methyltransferase/2-methoxy-6-polyprenyl-1,4-benzoquinol methylase UbiE [Gammaproteobacteria bacterium]|nr:bifunctional demethylmenaquinone methyltransferase/2-methoxy-6-polyprenyl-1,4-benzoquinol methylase UbiE [Gammaproteobacteria bacterium]